MADAQTATLVKGNIALYGAYLGIGLALLALILLALAPDGKSLWVNSTVANAVFEYSLPDLQLIGHAELPEVHPQGRARSGAVPEWITFTPDSKFVYISDSALRVVSVIDAHSLKEVAQIPVGEVPKRIITLAIH